MGTTASGSISQAGSSVPSSGGSFSTTTSPSSASSPKKSILSKEATESDEGTPANLEALQANPKIGAWLQSVPLLAKLTSEERAKLGGALVEKKYADNEVIIRQGEEGKGFYIINKGTVSVTREDEKTKLTAEIARLKGGDFFGEAALLKKGEKRGATITAVGPVQCFYLARKHFETLINKQVLKIQFAKRKAISAESEKNVLKYTPKRPAGTTQQKSDEQIRLIEIAVKDNILFLHLEPTHKKAIIKEMYLLEVKKGVDVIVQGALGDNFYVVETGSFDIFVDKKKVTSRGKGTCFGELALMYNSPRKATVTAAVDSSVWVVDRYTFRRVVTDLTEKKFHGYVDFLSKVELLTPLASFEREKLAEALEEVSFPAGKVIFKQGDEGDCMYLIHAGDVRITKADGTSTEEKEVARCKAGDYFGERALIKNEARAATVTACSPTLLLKIDRNAFLLLLGPLEDILKEKALSYERMDAEAKLKKASETRASTSTTTSTTTEPEKAGPEKILRDDLKVVGTLGKGSFGHVQLVQHKKTGKTYALKAVGKAQIVQTGQQGHIMSEKRVMEQLDHPFLVRLYATYKDKDRLYFLLEPALGGELFSVLREKTLFDEPTARFFAACVVSAFEYMHSKNIIYRDLKPENLLLDKQGYLKVTDFGFAKDISSGRTWTLCGTPDYLAPEIVAGKGHGKGVDWWTLGVFIYEMLASYPPFYDEDPMKTYAKIMHGNITFPSHFTKEAISIVKKLLHHKPFKRLGVVKGGAKLVKKHPWFKDIDWDALYAKKIQAPIIPTIRSDIDIGNFDDYPEEEDEVEPYVDDGSNWDADF